MLAKLTVRKSSGLVKNQKGITLIELLAVIVILGIIAAIAIPAIGGMISKSRINADVESLNLIRDAALRYAMTEGLTDDTPLPISGAGSLVEKGYLASAPRVQSGEVAAFHTVNIVPSNAVYKIYVHYNSTVDTDASLILPSSFTGEENDNDGYDSY